nr:isoform 3 of probable galactinol--sucrose galactosyltransferase 2 [Quercus suber]
MIIPVKMKHFGVAAMKIAMHSKEMKNPLSYRSFRTAFGHTIISSGDVNVQTSQSLEAVFINSGDYPFELLKNSIKILEKHEGTFSHIEYKKMPAHWDWFGWCSWDAFYAEVSPQGIKEGLQSFLEGGCLSKFLIIVDGRSETVNDFCKKEGEPFIEGTQ